eukprot:scaffold64926_cov60-Phaeocystis_antarctica.AAC.1
MRSTVAAHGLAAGCTMLTRAACMYVRRCCLRTAPVTATCGLSATKAESSATTRREASSKWSSCNASLAPSCDMSMRSMPRSTSTTVPTTAVVLPGSHRLVDRTRKFEGGNADAPIPPGACDGCEGGLCTSVGKFERFGHVGGVCHNGATFLSFMQPLQFKRPCGRFQIRFCYERNSACSDLTSHDATCGYGAVFSLYCGNKAVKEATVEKSLRQLPYSVLLQVDSLRSKGILLAPTSRLTDASCPSAHVARRLLRGGLRRRRSIALVICPAHDPAATSLAAAALARRTAVVALASAAPATRTAAAVALPTAVVVADAAAIAAAAVALPTAA